MRLSEMDRQLRQTAAEILAFVVLDLFPTAKLIGGGPTRVGFGYHFHFEFPFLEESLELLQRRMNEVLLSGKAIIHREMLRKNAAEMLSHHGQALRAEEILKGPPGLVPVFELDGFFDVTNNLFLENTAAVGACRLTHFQIEEHTYIGGLAFADRKELDAHYRRQVLEKKRDHRRLGKELDLFSPSVEAGRGTWMWHPKGMTIQEEIRAWWEKAMQGLGCRKVATPPVCREDFACIPLGLSEAPVGPCNEFFSMRDVAAGHSLLFGRDVHSHKDAPICYYELAQRLGLPDELEVGLKRSWSQTFLIATFFFLPRMQEQLLSSILQFMLEAVRIFGFECRARVTEFGRGVVGSRKEWASGRKALVQVLEAVGVPFDLTGASEGETGPQLLLEIEDALGRIWDGPRVQFNFNVPAPLKLRFQSADGEMISPLMLSLSTFDSLEALVALLVEHFAGELPVWLAPEQVRVLAITSNQLAKARELCQELVEQGVRAGLDERKETLGAKVRLAQLRKIPYTVVIGDREEKENRIAVRLLNRDEVLRFSRREWIDRLQQEIRTKALGDRTARG